jgi:hypothetical protein
LIRVEILSAAKKLREIPADLKASPIDGEALPFDMGDRTIECAVSQAPPARLERATY